MQESWRLIRSGRLSGAENMALDEALLHAVAAGRSAPVLRLYRWQPAAVSLGYGQRGPEVVNLAACRELGYDVVRRCTGGRAVLHDREVTYAVVSAERSPIFPGGILANYRIIAEALQQALSRLDIAAELAPQRSRGKTGEGAAQSACFTAPGQFELLYRGCKIAGCAQKRFAGAFLQHGSIPVDLDAEKLFRALDTRGHIPPAAGGRLLEAHVGWVNRWRSPAVSIDQAEEALLEAFAERLRIEFREAGPSPEELAHASELLQSRYASPAWTENGLSWSGPQAEPG